LKNGAKSVMGIEINKDFISIARKNLSLSDVEIVNSSIYDAEKVNKKFDVIYSNMVFDQVQDLDLVFRKISSLLKKGGKIIFVAPHPLSTVTGDYSKFFDNYFVGRKVYHVPKSHNNRLPCYTRTFGDYSKLFYENNLCIEEIVEPKPSACSKKIFPAAYDIYTKLPSVVIFSLSKKENG